MSGRDHYVGIRNSSGVSCHVSSAIQLLHHAIDVKNKGDLITLSQLLSCNKLDLKNDDSSSSLKWEAEFLIHLGQLLGEMVEIHDPPKECDNHNNKSSGTQNRHESSIDPSNIFQFLHPKLDTSIPGDAATSLRFLMKFLREAIEHICDALVEKGMEDEELGVIIKSLKQDFHESFWRGILNHQVSGFKIVTHDASTGCEKVIRSKPTKERPLSFPVTLPMQKYESNTLIDAFNSIISKPQPISGYNWDAMDETEYNQEVITIDGKDCNVNGENSNESGNGSIIQNLDQLTVNSQQEMKEEREKDQSDSSSSESSSYSSSCDSDDSSTSSSSSSSDISSKNLDKWNTEKKIWLSSVPSCLFFHLRRFEYRGGKVHIISSKMDIPSTFYLCQSVASLDSCCHDGGRTCPKYSLMGAIVYNDDKNEKSDSNDIGHYLSYLKKKDENSLHKRCPSEEWIKIDDENIFPLLVTDSISEVNDDNCKVISTETLMKMFGGTSTKAGHWSASVLLYRISREDTSTKSASNSVTFRP